VVTGAEASFPDAVHGAEDAPPDVDALIRLLSADPETPAGRIELHWALMRLQRMSTEELLSLGPETVDRLFHTFTLAAYDLPETDAGLQTLMLGLAVYGTHLDWRSGGAEFLASLSPRTRERLEQLAAYVDERGASYAERRVQFDLPALLSDSGSSSMGEILAHLRAQASAAAGEAPAATGNADLRGLALQAVRMAESMKAAALAELRTGQDLSQSRIMQLQEQLQSANQIIEAFNQILKKENELIESLVRNLV
jgi:hypothetical protein